MGMGISHSNAHKRKKTGGKKSTHEKKRKSNSGRPPANTKVGQTNKVKPIRTRGGNKKLRALRISHGSFSLRPFNITCYTKIDQVLYHPSSNEYTRTNTLTKSSVVKISPEPFNIQENTNGYNLKEVDPTFLKLLESGECYGIVTSRPGQVGKVDGYVLQGEELQFYMNKFKKRRIAMAG